MRAPTLALALLATSAVAEEPKPKCNLDSTAVIQCENGGRTFRVIREALSRTGRYGVAWALVDPKDKDKIEDRNGEQMADGLDVENVIIHLPDGIPLKTLPGDHFGDAQRYNHKEHSARWSDYDLWVVVANDSKWQTDNANVYSIDENDRVTVTGPFDLMAFCADAAHKFFARGSKRFNWDNYSNGLLVKEVTLNGDVKLVFTMQVPKGERKDDLFEADIELHMEKMKDSLAAKLTSIKPHKE